MDKWTSGAAYDQWMGRWSRLVADAFAVWLDLPSNLRWLDVCCGSGVLTEAILNYCAPVQVAGVDASPQQIDFARAHRAGPNVTFETGDAMHLRFDDATFDAIICGLGLNYLPNQVDALREMQRVAVSKGSSQSMFGTTGGEYSSCASSGTPPQLVIARRWNTIRPTASRNAIPRIYESCLREQAWNN